MVRYPSSAPSPQIVLSLCLLFTPALTLPALAGPTTSASVYVTKTTTQVAPLPAGSNAEFEIGVNNEGPDDAADVTLDDTLPPELLFQSLDAPAGWSCTTPAVGASGTIACSRASFVPGTEVFTVEVQIAAGTASGTVLTNTAVVGSTTPDPDPENDSASASLVVGAGPTLGSLTLTIADSPDPVAVGGEVTYTVTVTTDLIDATLARFSFPLPSPVTFVALSAPAGFTCTTPAVGAGGAISCTAPTLPVGDSVWTVDTALAAGTGSGRLIAAAASITIESDGREVVAAGTTDTTVTAVPLAADKTVAGSFVPNEAVTYTLVLTNDSSLDQPDNPGDELVDVLPAELELLSASLVGSGTVATNLGTNTVTWNGTLTSGGTATITIDARLRSNVPGGTAVANSATLAYDYGETGTNDGVGASDDPNTVPDPDPTVFVSLGALPPLTVDKTVSGSFNAGEAIEYTLTLTNNSTIDQPDNPGSEVVDTLPPELILDGASLVGPGTLTIDLPGGVVSWDGLLPAGQSATITIQATIRASADGPVANQAVVAFDPSESGTNSGSGVSDDPSTGAADDPTVFVALGAAPPLTVEKSASGSFFNAGDAVEFTLTLSNNSTIDQPDNPGSEVVDTLPPQLILVGASLVGPGALTLDLPGGVVSWDGALTPGQTATITIQATIREDADGEVANQAVVAYDPSESGTNSGSGVSDDPSTDEADDPTVFVATGIAVNIPTLGLPGAAALALLLALAGAFALRRS